MIFTDTDGDACEATICLFLFVDLESRRVTVHEGRQAFSASSNLQAAFDINTGSCTHELRVMPLVRKKQNVRHR